VRHWEADTTPNPPRKPALLTLDISRITQRDVLGQTKALYGTCLFNDDAAFVSVEAVRKYRRGYAKQKRKARLAALPEFDRYCGAYVCRICNNHHGLARCYCGWASDGGNGRQQLVEMGETIDPEDY
jgi:hypothetical protein